MQLGKKAKPVTDSGRVFQLGVKEAKKSGKCRRHMPPQRFESQAFTDGPLNCKAQFVPVVGFSLDMGCGGRFTSRIQAIFTINSFEKGGDGVMTTPWLLHCPPAGLTIREGAVAIHANGRAVTETVVAGASQLWDVIQTALTSHHVITILWMHRKQFGGSSGIREDQDEWGWLDIHWTDA